MIKSLLIANRGEIACRIIKTARRMGIKTIAIYSSADAEALHVRMADEAHYVGNAPASDSYLRSGRILSVAKQAGADAIHPGYGFLSENADFAALTEEAGMIFVGPPPSAIKAMGLKDKAKEIMQEAGVPVVAGFHGKNQEPSFLKRKAYEIGYPVLIKAVAGGGGKGMRHVPKALDFDKALEAAKREALAAFGNDIVLIEKFIEQPRHIEMQIFADAHGNVVHLFERDCSLQRRHQKVIEEAPAPGMSTKLRAAMGEAACAAAKAVNYQGAGTVEFIVDGANGLQEDGFFFMEMNTRLQVEHPVSEMISGVDLVEWQLRVAQGEKLPKTQDELAIKGYAVEARIYAEDPNHDFLPSVGKVIALDLGRETDYMRVDSGVAEGDEISPYYDPMIAKLIVHGQTRTEALNTLANCLTAARIAGPKTNLAFLARLCTEPSFQKGHFDTSLIETKLPSLISTEPVGEDVIVAGVSGLLSQKHRMIENDKNSPWSVFDSFQISGKRELAWVYKLDGVMKETRLRFEADGLAVQSATGEWVFAQNTAEAYQADGQVFVLKEGRQSIFENYEFILQETEAESLEEEGAIIVPMHGRIISVTVQNGDEVEEGDLLFSIESMKMEHAILAPSDGFVEALSIETGQQAESGFVALRLLSSE